MIRPLTLLVWPWPGWNVPNSWSPLPNPFRVQRRSPLLPGLFPDVPADNPIAYAFWIGAYDTPPSGALSRITPLLGPRVSLAMRAGDSEIEGVLRSVASLQAQVHPDWELCPWPASCIRRGRAAPCWPWPGPTPA